MLSTDSLSLESDGTDKWLQWNVPFLKECTTDCRTNRTASFAIIKSNNQAINTIDIDNFIFIALSLEALGRGLMP